MRLSKRLNVYSDNEYSHTQNMSMAGKLIRAQAERIRKKQMQEGRKRR